MQEPSTGTSLVPVPQLHPRIFASVIKHTPLVAIDLVALNDRAEVLLGLRRNAPARGYWFVPGGRILKGETLSAAMARILRDEISLTPGECGTPELIGVFEHFYSENFMTAPGFGTHYVVLAYRLDIGSVRESALPGLQHAGYRWMRAAEMTQAKDVHPHVRAYGDCLMAALPRHSPLQSGNTRPKASASTDSASPSE